MKVKIRLLPIAAVASALTLPMLAADKEDRRDTWSGGRTSEQWRSQRMERLGKVAKASEIIGMPVKNQQNEKLGDVEELAVDLEAGRIVEVILASGGILGVGEKRVAVPPGAFTCDETDKALRLDADKARLKNAPAVELSKWDELSDRNRIVETYRYYGQEPYFSDVDQSRHARVYQTERDPRYYTTDRKVQSPHAYRASTRSFPTDRQCDIAYLAPGETPYDQTDQDYWVNRDQRSYQGNKEENTTYRADGSYQVTVVPLGHVARASKIIGMTVKNKQDEKVGKVDNLMVDLSNGRIVHVVVSSGGFLGVADELCAVPPSAFDYDASQEVLQLDVSKDALTKAPHFRSSEWPNFSTPDYSRSVYRAYNVNPYFTEDADNTARNVRDRKGGTLTPVNQGNSKADLDITKRIRREILEHKELSLNARNVKVITVNGRVTIRGPVNTDLEKRIITGIADRIAQRDNVDIQLEVKRTVSDN